MSDTAKKPLGPRSIQSHQAILQVTLELLAEVGYERTSIDATAARAGGKTTIYRRYASKELVADAIESLREEVHTRHWHPQEIWTPLSRTRHSTYKVPCPPDHSHDYRHQ